MDTRNVCHYFEYAMRSTIPTQEPTVAPRHAGGGQYNMSCATITLDEETADEMQNVQTSLAGTYWFLEPCHQSSQREVVVLVSSSCIFFSM